MFNIEPVREGYLYNGPLIVHCSLVPRHSVWREELFSLYRAPGNEAVFVGDDEYFHPHVLTSIQSFT